MTLMWYVSNEEQWLLAGAPVASSATARALYEYTSLLFMLMADKFLCRKMSCRFLDCHSPLVSSLSFSILVQSLENYF